VTAQGGSLYDTYGGSPVHRFYQMWQELDCDATKATKQNPSGCQADLFPWVEQTVSAGSNGAAPASPPPVPLLKEGNIAMGFYNVAKGDVPYLTKLAREYTINDNYHQPVMGGTFANEMMVGYADALYYADSKGNPATPPAAQIENPNPLSGTNNWYTNDGYGNVSTGIGGSYTDCSDTTQPGVAAIVNYLKAIKVQPNCAPKTYYLLNNYVPAYIGSGKTDPVNNGPFTLPPVIKQRHIGDTLNQANVSWAWFGERWTDFKTAPGLGANYGTIDPPAYLFCNICSPFLYSQSIMTHQDQREAHLKDVNALYDGIANNTLPAVSFVKPSTFNDGHPASSKVDIFEPSPRKSSTWCTWRNLRPARPPPESSGSLPPRGRGSSASAAIPVQSRCDRAHDWPAAGRRGTLRRSDRPRPPLQPRPLPTCGPAHTDPRAQSYRRDGELDPRGQSAMVRRGHVALRFGQGMRGPRPERPRLRSCRSRLQSAPPFDHL